MAANQEELINTLKSTMFAVHKGNTEPGLSFRKFFEMLQNSANITLHEQNGLLHSIELQNGEEARPGEIIARALTGLRTRAGKSARINLPGLDFTGIDYREAGDKQTEFHLTNYNLEGANLQGITISNIWLDKTNLQGAQLQGATITNTSLEDADLQEADLSGLTAQRLNLKRTNLRHARTDENTSLKEIVGFDGRPIRKAQLDRLPRFYDSETQTYDNEAAHQFAEELEKGKSPDTVKNNFSMLATHIYGIESSQEPDVPVKGGPQTIAIESSQESDIPVKDDTQTIENENTAPPEAPRLVVRGENEILPGTQVDFLIARGHRNQPGTRMDNPENEGVKTVDSRGVEGWQQLVRDAQKSQNKENTR